MSARPGRRDVPEGGVDIEALARAAARGDPDALAELVVCLQGPVWRFAYHLTRSRDLADEASQETWARAVRSLPRFRGESSVLTWLLAIARHVVAGLLREQCRRPPETAPPPPWTSTGLVEVEAELARLPAPLQEALVLTQVVGLTYEEAAEVMEVRIGTVRSRVFRGRAALVEALRDGTEVDVTA
jgi:RNA polymerase sigma-70 factor, ECF subfamily